MKSIFEKYFRKILDEDNVAASGGVFGTWAGDQFSADTYAPGDSRIPKSLFSVQRRLNSSKKRRRKKRRNKKK